MIEGKQIRGNKEKRKKQESKVEESKVRNKCCKLLPKQLKILLMDLGILT
jgi:hypothetical protein